MMSMHTTKMEHYREFVLERCLLHAQSYLSLVGPMFASEAQFAMYADRCAEGLVLSLQTSAIKGEIVDETRTLKVEYSFPVFATWWDHLKYDLREGRVWPWIPRRLVQSLSIKYTDIKKTREESVPVKVTKICPHATFKWDGQMRKHVAFLEGK